MSFQDTIFAPATASGIAGVGIIRISGKQTKNVIQKMTFIKNLKSRYAFYTKFHHPLTQEVLDEGILIFFEGPNSFTGEDVAEFHVHGGRAVMLSILEALGKIEECRFAERGEYSRRAVLNGKMDLTQAEGMLDLIHAQTSKQKEQAFRQMSGALEEIYTSWRKIMVHELALMEAYIDFPEEEIPDSILVKVQKTITDLIAQIKDHLSDNHKGENLREGFHITLVGAPNVGKSSLLNKLVQKDVAIVSKTAGTTRDVIETYFDVKGYPVIFQDTAGLRETNEEIEQEGIKRAFQKIEASDIILLLSDAADYPKTTKEIGQILEDKTLKEKALFVWNKKDLNPSLPKDVFSISAKTGENISKLWTKIEKEVEEKMGLNEAPALTRLRYRQELEKAVLALEHFLNENELELQAENLRQAARSIGKITGVVEVEELFDVIFQDFCIGK